jgi:uncharacterized protein with PIN domain
MRAHFRFYAELNEFLPPDRRMVEFTHEFASPASVKDMIESLGIPHTEVDLILANGRSVDFTYLVADEDRISVYPVFESLDITPVLRVRPQPLRQTRFVLDQHLGRLAAYLRLLGFDSLYRNDYGDEELAHISSQDQRILLTRDRGLLKRSEVTHGYCLRSTVPDEQLFEVVQRFDLAGSIHPFTRCLRCNGPLESVPKAEIADRLSPNTAPYYDTYRICRACNRVYWPGPHYRRMAWLVEQVRERQNAGQGPPSMD